MLDKIKNVFTLILICFIVFSIGYGIYRLISNADVEKNLITSEEVVLYAIQDNELKTYSTYYHIKDCFDNFVKACELGEYEAVYSIYMKDYVEQYDKSEVITKLQNLISKGSETDYVVSNIYQVEDDYLVKSTINGQDVNFMFDISVRGEHSYEFAFIK